MRKSLNGYGLIFAIALLSAPAAAQTAAAPAAGSPSLYDLSVADATAAQNKAQNDTRVVALLGFGPALAAVSSIQLDKAETVPFLSGQSAKPPSRFVDVLLFNKKTNLAASVRVRLDGLRVVSVEPVAINDVPIFREEAEQALAIARADAKLRAAVGPSIDSFRLRPSGTDDPMPFAAEILPLTASSVRDLCFTGRCVELIFRTDSGYLPLRAQVNIAARTVTVIRRNAGAHGGMQH